MSIAQIQNEIDHLKSIQDRTHQYYHHLLKQCVQLKEMEAVVFIYDMMREKNVSPNPETYSIINNLHSKTIIENNRLRIPKEFGKRTLAPRRRIHKIMKGYYYHDQHTEALKYVSKVKGFLDIHPEYKNTRNRFFLAETLHKNCHIPIKICRVVITHLKKTKYLVSNVSKPLSSKKISLDKSNIFLFDINTKQESALLEKNKMKRLYRQQTIGEFFK